MSFLDKIADFNVIETVANEDMGKNIKETLKNKIKDITVYAKTGTAQTSSLEKRDQGQKFKEHTWFIGSMQYQNTKPLVIVTIFEHCGDHKEILSFIKKFLMRYRSYCSENKQ